MNREEIIAQLKSQSTWRLFFLSLITFGIYTAHYASRQTKIINRALEGNYISQGFVNFLIIAAYVSVLFLIPYLMVEEGHPLAVISNVLDYIWIFAIVFWAFMARNRMNFLLAASEGETSWFHGLWTFLFAALYFNFKINRLNDSYLE